MLLWSLFGVIQFLGCVVIIGQYAAYERENVFSSTWDFLYSGTTLAALLVMWIAFFPPKIYLRWINGTVPVKL
jgi:Na+-driven multidrug efflux pump